MYRRNVEQIQGTKVSRNNINKSETTKHIENTGRIIENTGEDFSGANKSCFKIFYEKHDIQKDHKETLANTTAGTGFWRFIFT